MTSRERVLLALRHQEPDRVPRDLGGTESSGMTAHALYALQEHTAISGPRTIFEPYQYVATIPEELRVRFKVDTVNLTQGPKSWVASMNPEGFDVLLPEKWVEESEEGGATVVRGSDGEVTARRPGGGYYFDPVSHPLHSITDYTDIRRYESIIHSFDMPSFADESLEDLLIRARAMKSSGECVVFNLCCHVLAAGQLLRGYENFMVDLLSDEPMVTALLECLIDGYRSRVDAMAPLLRDEVDVLLLNDDLGTQAGPMLSPDVYRKLIKPYQKELFEYVTKAFAKPILFHSCGAVREFIPDLIEIGVDALNPVQLSADGMQLGRLKRDFGNDITFWGGGIDTQAVLNRATPAGVIDAVKENVDILAPGGGFVFCQVHNVQPDVPPQNVVAMFDALDEIGM